MSAVLILDLYIWNEKAEKICHFIKNFDFFHVILALHEITGIAWMMPQYVSVIKLFINIGMILFKYLETHAHAKSALKPIKT